MKRFHTEFRSVTSGNSLGMEMPPLINLTIAMPAVITTKTTASATEIAEVYLSESAKQPKFRALEALFQFKRLSFFHTEKIKSKQHLCNL